MNDTTPVTLSSSAAARIAVLINQQKNPNLKFKITVKGGGCSGFQYDFDLVEEHNDNDILIEKDGVTMIVDGLSILYLTGSEVDFVEELAGSLFVVHNPASTATCGCGSSFAI